MNFFHLVLKNMQTNCIYLIYHIQKHTWPLSSANDCVIICALKEAVTSVLLLEYETNNYSRNPLSEAAIT